MKRKSEKKESPKFGLERFEVARLKNLTVLKGGGDDPVDTNNTTKKPSNIDCGK
ncbi:hypothetical protein NU08_1337 [Flavobacterium anhuiense]|uniref:Uncharacterized protein n=1 Tax=Flavobacterium anhuiense TaxID=459526 RepID=A0A444W1Z3_9FLAO|nr:hypothetical protein [Flavobacterium anhuiense]RYJ39668.1 hypothetical protein NU08_1337 [Flavobacterium anhuiense]